MRKELLPGEQVIVVTRPQPRTLIVPALMFILVPALAAYASAWIVKGGPAQLIPLIKGSAKEWTPWLIGVCIALAAWVLLGYCLPRVMTWHATKYTLTSQRLVTRYGMLRRRDQQVSLHIVHNVVIHQSLLQRILRSGNISLETGYPTSMVVPDVPEVATFRNFILDAINDLPRDGVPGSEGMMHNPDAARPWDTREGGRDER
ncbi:membrane protein YdbS with pleckstrin-like domain [Arthrobacter ginsengisoli]|uniref:Membrane protein YdbS with pleckstrin-like domain n=1 Tax=Arthrobacter ginsengisoli TaxID=1356565 RepID=A0ABU1U8D0_9MICC|nr:PH domain-containing protein [Arthrobacter ginsengisoli]MDR7081355.1 membrane protein YdbS with pleckstrin-like domain [Arthrobacter ginsengisoli]